MRWKKQSKPGEIWDRWENYKWVQLLRFFKGSCSWTERTRPKASLDFYLSMQGTSVCVFILFLANRWSDSSKIWYMSCWGLRYVQFPFWCNLETFNIHKPWINKERAVWSALQQRRRGYVCSPSGATATINIILAGTFWTGTAGPRHLHLLHLWSERK